MAIKIPKIQNRIEKVLAHLQSGDLESASSRKGVLVLADAYKWFYQSGRYDFGADQEEDRFNYDLITLDLFDVLADGGHVVEANVGLWEKRREEYRRSPHILGTPAVDSNLSVSPYFDDSFQNIPKPKRREIINKLKLLAKSTNRPASSIQTEIRRLCKVKNGLPCIELAPGIDLVVELESIQVCFMGFMFAGGQPSSLSRGEHKNLRYYLTMAARWVAFLPLAFAASWIATKFFMFFRFGNLERFAESNSPYVVLVFMLGVTLFMQILSGSIIGWVGVQVAPKGKKFALACCVVLSALVALAYFAKFNDVLGGVAALAHVIATFVAGYLVLDD